MWNGASDGEGLPDLRHDDVLALHLGHELVCVGIEHAGERAVVARDDGRETEELLAGEGGRPRPHREPVADRHDADVGRMQFRDQRHVGENVRVAHVIEGLAFPGLEDDAVGIAEIDVGGGGVQGVGEGEIEIGRVDGAARVHGFELLGPLPLDVHGEFEVGDQRGGPGLAYLPGVAEMIRVAMRQRHVRDAGDRIVPGDPGFFEGRIALEERIDQHHAIAGLDPKAGMSEPDQFHRRPSPRGEGAF